jgi:large subunit ribosomal protein L17
MCIIELVDYNENMLKETKKAAKKATRRAGKKAAKEEAAEVVAEAAEAPKAEEAPAAE